VPPITPPPTIPITSNFLPRHLPLPTQFHHHSQFHTWAHPITHPLSPPFPISHMGTSDHSPTLPITSNILPRRLPLMTQFYHHSQFPSWAPSITLPLFHHFNFHTWAPPITHTISPPLSILHTGTSDYPPTFPTTPNCTHEHFRSPPHFPHHFQFHTSEPPISHQMLPPLPMSPLGTCNYPPTFFTTSNFTHGDL
jgi:hypothetical protein